MNLVKGLRTAKHQLFLGTRAVQAAGRAARDRAVYPAVNAVQPTVFDHARFAEADGQFPMDYFLNRGPEHRGVWALAPARIFALWTGDNGLSPNRLAALESIRAAQSADVEVTLVTPDRLHEWEVAGSPIHPAYERLSLVHRSDYLRCYLMHHHGGGYTDIKHTAVDWRPFFGRLNADRSAWVLGYPEQSSREAAYMESPLGREIRRRYAELAGNGAFICKPGTPLTTAWLDEVSARMDYYHRALERNPAIDPFGQAPGYPLPWTVLQAQVFQPLQLQYLDRVLLDPALRPSMKEHR